MLPATTATAVQTTTECMEIVLELILQIALIAMSPFGAAPMGVKQLYSAVASCDHGESILPPPGLPIGADTKTSTLPSGMVEKKRQCLTLFNNV